jgi:uncharacterized membrane protein YesL
MKLKSMAQSSIGLLVLGLAPGMLALFGLRDAIGNNAATLIGAVATFAATFVLIRLADRGN